MSKSPRRHSRAARARAVPADRSQPLPSVLEDAEALTAMVRAEIADLSAMKPTKSMTTRTQRQNQIKRCADILRKLGEVTGESLRIPESKIVRLPAFRRVVDEIVRALEPWPEAMASVGQALDRIERGEAADRTGT